MTAPKTKPAEASANGNGQADPLAQAISYEQAIADEAAEIRGDAAELTPELYMQLRPLLRKPIPSAFIVTTGKTEGKPYPSTGVKSLQVLTDRMDNVLTPFWWGYDVEFIGPDGVDARGVPNAGRLAEVTVWVGPDRERALIVKRSRGGVNQASTIGNLFKGSETNAAKRAFAAIGPAWEVYVGAADFDPDTDEDAAGQQRAVEQTQAQTLPVIDGDRVAQLTDLAASWVTAAEGEDEQKKRTTQITRLLRSEGLTGAIETVTQGLARLTPGQADNVEAWLREQSKGGDAA